MRARPELDSHHHPSNKHDEDLDDVAQQMQVVLETNALLEQMDFGSHCFETYADLVASVSSMSVALYEKIFQFRLETIRRTPQDYHDYVANAQCIVDALSGALLDESFEIEHMTGESLCQGDVASIQQLIFMFQQIYELLYTAHDPVVSNEPRQRKKKSNQITPARISKTERTQQVPVKKRTRRGVVPSKPKTVKDELLTTQQYGRFVPVPQRNRLDVGISQDEKSVDLATLGPGQTKYFGGVSSVSGASESGHGSVHYMDEEGDVQNFSSIPSHSSPATHTSPSVQQTPESGASKDTETPMKKSSNQQQSEDWLSQQETRGKPSRKNVAKTRITPTTSPAKKKLATKREVQTKRTTSKENAELYPLIPHSTRHDQTSKASMEYQRYKIQLKDHLQDLRHREFCQRQHAERTYRLGEHAANVERIRTRRFEQELRFQRVSRGLQEKEREEKQLKQTFEQLLQMEKERLRQEQATTSRVLNDIQQQHTEREQALEQFYTTQLELIREQTKRERQERQVVERAHRMASKQMLRELEQERQRDVSQALEYQKQMAKHQHFRRTTSPFYTAAIKARQQKKRL